MLGEFTREDKANRGLDFTSGDGGLLRVGSEFYRDCIRIDQQKEEDKTH